MADSQRKTALLYDNPLCGISTYKDTLNLATGVCARQIKKLVLTGNESGWVMSGTGYFYNLTLSDNPKEMSAVVSTHFTATTTPGTVEIGCIRFGGTAQSPTQPLIFNYDKGAIGLTAFKQWLAAQYSAGTPVTVWYVLETPTTETITVPSGLSGTEEGYLNQSGTPTPTNPIYPTANNVEIWLHSLRKLTIATEVVENPLYSDGTAITNYTISGNTVQNGTPTPSNPVDVNGVGVRTGNLCPTTWVQGDIDSATGADDVSNDAIRSDFIPIELNKYYSIYRSIKGGFVKIRLYDNSKAYVGSGTNHISLIVGGAGATPTNPLNGTDNFCCIQIISSSAKYMRIVDTTNNLSTAYMFVEGEYTAQTMPSYEPYGYKIPISSADITTNIYLGEVQTTRKVRKMVLTGDEYFSTGNTNSYGITNYALTISDRLQSLLTVLCTHFERQETPLINTQNEGIYNGSSLFFRSFKNSLANFKAYLQQQYTVGTPITVWYVLENETTAAVNEPLMKIGEYADTVSNAASIPTTGGANSITVDTTVQPSEFTATWTGWHDANVKEWNGSQWIE